MTLQELREKIEEIDDDIIRLIRARMDVALNIAETKTITGLPTHDPDRVDAVLRRVMKKAESLKLDPDSIRDVFSLLIRMSEDMQDMIRK
jgi:chorismate mutase